MTLQPAGPAGRFLLPGLTLTLDRPLIADGGLDLPVADLFVRLHSLGWGRARDEHARVASEPLVDVHVGPAGVWLYADNLHDINAGVIMADSGPPPRPPDGWWSWVDRFGQRCAVTLIADALDLTSADIVAALNRSAQQGSVLMAHARVVRDGPVDFTSGPSRPASCDIL